MLSINDSVGRSCKNNFHDVKNVQIALNENAVPTKKLATDGKFGSNTFEAIVHFQMSIFSCPSSCDGRIEPNGATLRALNNPRAPIVKLVTPEAAQAQTRGAGGHKDPDITPAASPGKLSDVDFQSAARLLNIEVAMIKAFAAVESGGRSGFGATGFPRIAYEGHKFRKFTKNVYNNSYPLLSYHYKTKAGPEWKANNKNDETSVATLKKAMVLNPSAALKSCSWGMFQIMGEYFRECGFTTVEAFVDGVKSSEVVQLNAFVKFCKSKSGLQKALASKDFINCARLYNGEDYGDYDKRISKAYAKYSQK